MNTVASEINLNDSPMVAAMLTFDQVLDIIAQWPRERQEMLFDVVHQRLIDAQRRDIAQSVQESVMAYRQGELPAEDASAAIARLRALLAEEA